MRVENPPKSPSAVEEPGKVVVWWVLMVADGFQPSAYKDPISWGRRWKGGARKNVLSLPSHRSVDQEPEMWTPKGRRRCTSLMGKSLGSSAQPFYFVLLGPQKIL